MAKAFYDRISGVYDLISDASEQEARQRGVEALRVQAGERVLEIGFGTGHVLVVLAHAVGSSGHVAGVDVSTGMREVAARRLAEAGLESRVELTVAAVPPLPYDDDNFDAAFMSFTLELFALEQIPAVLGEASRVLRPGGRLGVVAMDVTPAGQHESMLTHTYKWMHRHFPHIVDCQPIDARAALGSAGFKATHEDELDIWSLPVAILVGRTAGEVTAD